MTKTNKQPTYNASAPVKNLSEKNIFSKARAPAPKKATEYTIAKHKASVPKPAKLGSAKFLPLNIVGKQSKQVKQVITAINPKVLKPSSLE